MALEINKMLNKDKRSMVLSLVLGDGCLHYIKNNGRIFGGLTIDHGIKQADYQSWKASLLSTIFNKNIKVRTGHKGKSVQLSLCTKRFRAWRKFCYPNNKKDIAKILPFINNPAFALAIWLADDGYAEVGKNIKSPNSISSRLRIFTCDQSIPTQEVIIKWFKTQFNVNAKIKYAHSKQQNKSYPYIKFTQEDSLKLWGIIRDFILQFKSMQYKFRHIEQVYQLRILQRVPDRRFKSTKSDDIVQPPSNSEIK
jgi:hypothetical protein